MGNQIEMVGSGEEKGTGDRRGREGKRRRKGVGVRKRGRERTYFEQNHVLKPRKKGLEDGLIIQEGNKKKN